MKRLLLLFALCSPICRAAQSAPAMQVPPGADARYKADILVVVAHPDDEGAVTPYLARAIDGEHRRVAVVYGTRGGSGANDFSAETGPSLAAMREIEARRACAALGITNVWFLGGKDTASQNVLQSLSNWGHGAALEELVRIVRLTRPEVILAWLPGAFVGENHGDHQAAGVLATEAFDLAGDPAVFPEQVAGAARRLEPWLGTLHPWQPKKIYYFSDASAAKAFRSAGPGYSVRELSPTRKLPYWWIAVDSFKAHRTQFPAFLDQVDKMSEQELEKAATDPNSGWPDPLVLIFGKSLAGGAKTDDVFSGITPEGARALPGASRETAEAGSVTVKLAGPWGFYEQFRRAHALESLPQAAVPELAVQAGSAVYVPLALRNATAEPTDVALEVVAPEGWKALTGAITWRLAAGADANLRVEVQTPALPQGSKANPTGEVVVRSTTSGRAISEIRLRVELRASALPQ